MISSKPDVPMIVMSPTIKHPMAVNVIQTFKSFPKQMSTFGARILAAPMSQLMLTDIRKPGHTYSIITLQYSPKSHPSLKETLKVGRSSGLNECGCITTKNIGILY